ncbi:hypothetical protein lam_556 [Candidatus Liberibacter americanus str. Sao Paulo]|uniref:Uncharacterized protein n=1 Tax=Candidatus Liberibacter americanus str. Sao Paulo TaxID=1261131 RepID=U6B4T5_9HYPH|nr:hypothetical protein lam_556 [Candidatus Liberibacter americanus str. Sao Paulo]
MRLFFLSYSNNGVFLYIILISTCFVFYTGCSYTQLYNIIKEKKNDASWNISALESNAYMKRTRLITNKSKDIKPINKYQETPADMFANFLAPKPPKEFYKVGKS